MANTPVKFIINPFTGKLDAGGSPTGYQYFDEDTYFMLSGNTISLVIHGTERISWTKLATTNPPLGSPMGMLCGITYPA
jgi:hypothetical protein